MTSTLIEFIEEKQTNERNVLIQTTDHNKFKVGGLCLSAKSKREDKVCRESLESPSFIH